MSAYEWKSEVTKYEVVTENGARGHVVRDPSYVPTRDFPERWQWIVEVPTPYSFGREGVTRIAGWHEHSADVAQARVEETLKLADQIAALKLDHIAVTEEIATDKINMKPGDASACLLCGLGERVQCLHAPEEVQLAFSLAMRLGRHEPNSSPPIVEPRQQVMGISLSELCQDHRRLQQTLSNLIEANRGTTIRTPRRKSWGLEEAIAEAEDVLEDSVAMFDQRPQRKVRSS